MRASVKHLYTAAAALALAACMPPQNNSQRLMEIARDTNVAARFGRLDVAVEHAAPATRDSFLSRRKDWGGSIRVVDINIAGIKETAPDEAEVYVQVSWTRMDEGLLRGTQVRQSWANRADGGWMLEREERVDGDVGLMGETVALTPPVPPRDVHFPTRTLRPPSR